MSELHDADPVPLRPATAATTAPTRWTGCGSTWTRELGAVDAETVRAHLAECQGCLEEYDVDVVVKTIVRRGCQEAAPDGLRLKIHEQLTVMRRSTLHDWSRRT